MQSENQTTHVMNKQGVELAELARQYGVSREHFTQFLKDEERTTKFFRSLDPITWFEDLKVEASIVGAELYLIPRLVVDYRISHRDAVRLTANFEEFEKWSEDLKEIMTSAISSIDGEGVADIGHLYPYPKKRKEIKETIVLVKWNPTKNITSFNEVIEWALQQGLQKTNPHVVFAIGAQCEHLELEDFLSQSSITETSGCLLRKQFQRFCEVGLTGLPRVTHHPIITEKVRPWLAFRR